MPEKRSAEMQLLGYALSALRAGRPAALAGLCGAQLKTGLT